MHHVSLKYLDSRYGVRAMVLFATTIVLFVFAVFVGPSRLYGQTDTAQRRQADTAQYARDAYPDFLTPSLRHGLDTTVSPCTDFNRFVNGGWRDSAKLEKGKDPIDVFKVTSRRTPLVLQRIMDSARILAPTTQDPDVRAVGYYYTSCMIADSLDRSTVGGRKPGVKGDTVRASLCRTMVMKHLQSALGQLYVRHVMTDKVDAEAMSLMQSIRNAVGERVRALSWISDAEKALVTASLEKMVFKVAKPSLPVDHQAIVLDTLNFVQNTRTLKEFAIARDVQEIGEDMTSMWGSTQYNPNASFRSVGNSIEVPSFMFQWPFFDPDDERTLGYGAVGMIIGHEMYHGVTSYLSSRNQEVYKARTKRLVEQFSALKPVEDVPINGEITLSENVADLGGMLASYQAWAQHVRPTEKPLIDGFTPEQRFFLYYARLWRAKGSTSYYGRLASDPHAVPSARINGVAMNVPAFAQAFGCKEGDPMANPAAERVEIW